MGTGRTVAATALVASALCAVLAGGGLPASADEPRVSLTWNAPDVCPREATVRASLATLLAGSANAVDARADVRRLGERWEVVLVMNGGERRLEADSCRALADATALIIAMAVDPARVAANRTAPDAGAASGAVPTESPPAADASSDAAVSADATDASLVPPPTVSAPPAVSTSAPSPPAVPAAPADATPSATPSPRRFSVAASATLDFGTLPAPAVGPALGFSWTPSPRRPFRLDLTAAYFPSSSTPIPGPVLTPGVASRAGTASFSFFAAALRACYLARPGSFELGPCGGVELGILEGSSEGIRTPSRGAGVLFAFDAGLFAAWHFSAAWALFARGDALLETNRETFEVNADQANPGTVTTPGLVAGRAAFGLELRF
jgi:hypothetical protein